MMTSFTCVNDLLAKARAYRLAEQEETPRICRGEALHQLGLDLDAAIEFCDVQIKEAADRSDIVAAAEAEHASDEVEIDSTPLLSMGEDGCWVSASVWVPLADEDESDE